MTCPSCGGELMISAKQDQAICSYCGKPFLVANNLKKAEVHAENLIKLASMAQASNNLGEANTYYSKALELEPNNIKALFGKAQVTAWRSTINDPSIDEAITYFEEAIDVAPDSTKELVKARASLEIAQVCASYIVTASENFKQLIKTLNDDLDNYNLYADKLEADWENFLSQTYFAINHFDDALNYITKSELKDKLLWEVYKVYDFILKGVVWQYRIEYDGPITNYVPTQYLRLDEINRQKIVSRLQNYASLTCGGFTYTSLLAYGEYIHGIPRVKPEEVVSFVTQESPSMDGRCRLYPKTPSQNDSMNTLVSRLFKQTETALWSMIPPPSEPTRRGWGGIRFLLFVLDDDILLEQGIFIATSLRFLYYRPEIPEKKKLFGIEPRVPPILKEVDYNKVISLECMSHMPFPKKALEKILNSYPGDYYPDKGQVLRESNSYGFEIKLQGNHTLRFLSFPASSWTIKDLRFWENLFRLTLGVSRSDLDYAPYQRTHN
jgi:tetratricopeptide (TPR) repeat protein